LETDPVALPAPEFFWRRRPPAGSRRKWNGSRASDSLAAGDQKSLLGRYRLLDVLLQKLGEIRERVDETLTARSPLQQHDEIEKDLREKWEDELTAAIEAEYRRQRGGGAAARAMVAARRVGCAPSPPAAAC